MPKKNEQWETKIGFVMASAGSAIGLGNIWKFPYMVGKNGGAAFILIYLLSVLFVGLPLMITEIGLGRASQSDPVGAFLRFKERKRLYSKIFACLGILLALCLFFNRLYFMASVVFLLSTLFAFHGWVCVGISCAIVPIVILAYYSIIGGWIIDYAFLSITGKLTFNNQETANTLFASITNNGCATSIYTMIYLFLTSIICWFGVNKGIETMSKWMMPLLLMLLLILIVRSVTLEGASEGIAFICKPNWKNINTNVVLSALGHSFYSTSIGMGILIAYGGYLPKNHNVIHSSLWIAFLDTLISIMAGFAIFPAIFAMKFEPAAGPSLIFKILPATFNSIPGSFHAIWNFAFFLLMTVAALTSSISLFESGVSTCMKQLHFSRHSSVLLLFAIISILSIPICFSTSNWENFPNMEKFLTHLIGNANGCLFDFVDNLCSNWILTLNGLFIAIFTIFVWKTKRAFLSFYRTENVYFYQNPTEQFHQKISLYCWKFIITFVSPVVIILTFLYATGIIQF